MNFDPSAVQGAMAQQGPGHQISVQAPHPGVFPNQPEADKPVQRTSGEVNADLKALDEGITQYQQAQEEEKEEKKSPAKDDYADDEYESLWGDNDLLNNKARRKRIEARCKPLDLEDYIMNGGVRQRVPIVPDKIEPTFRTAGTDEDLAVKRMMFGVQGTDIYISNRFSLMQLTLSLFAFNGEPLPDHLDKDGNFDEDLFNAKFARVSKYPTQLAEDLVTNYMWFDERVKQLFNEDLGNG